MLDPWWTRGESVVGTDGSGRRDDEPWQHDNSNPKEPPMFNNVMQAELAATRRHDLIAAADTQRLARQARRARRAQRHHGPAARVHRN